MQTTPDHPILLIGGDRDPNIASLDRSLRARDIPVRTVLFGHRNHPRLHWDLDDGALVIDGEPLEPSGLFIRHDVFAAMVEQRSEPTQRSLAWYVTIAGWALVRPEVRWLNRGSAREGTNKVEVLHLARQCGLTPPRTWITNDRDWLVDAVADDPIVKPVGGGAYTQTVRQVLPSAPHRGGALAAPAFVQEKLVSPEVRLFGVAGTWIAFRVESAALDYRGSSDTKLVHIPVEELPEGLIAGQARLMGRMKLNYGAADYKSCAETGELRFLEINNAAMFAAFDTVSDGAVTRAMGDFLAGLG